MDEFRRYIESKYGGKEVISSKNEPLIVTSIADLNFNNLEKQDQIDALDSDWAWGLKEEIRDEEIWHAILFRPTMREFLLSSRRFNALVGALGCGKTFCLGLKTVIMIFKHPGINHLWYRKSIPQLKSTTLRQLLEDVFPALGMKEKTHWRHHADPTERYVSVHVGDQESRIYYRPYKNQGISHDVMVDDIKSFNIDCIGIDEPNTLGLDTYLMIEGRTGRWTKDLPAELQQVNITGNPPSMNHWLNLMYGKGLDPVNPEKPLKNKEHYKMWYMSTYDNRDAVATEYLESLEAKSEEWKRTYLYGLPGFVEYSGVAIFAKNFQEDKHICYEPMKADPELPLLLGWDISSSGVDKACAIMQINKHATVCLLDEVVTDDPGLGPFINMVKQRITNFWHSNISPPHSFADPAAWTTSQVVMLSPATMLARSGFPSRKGAKEFPTRFNSVVELLTHDANDGQPGLLVNYHSCPVTIQGFLGGYQYKQIEEADRVLSAQPIKNLYSHIMDAIQYAASGVAQMFELGREKPKSLAEIRQPSFAPPAGSKASVQVSDSGLPKRRRANISERLYHSPLGRYRGRGRNY